LLFLCDSPHNPVTQYFRFGSEPVVLGMPLAPVALFVDLIGATSDFFFESGGPAMRIARRLGDRLVGFHGVTSSMKSLSEQSISSVTQLTLLRAVIQGLTNEALERVLAPNIVDFLP
jgi:hypothetical protein